MNIEVLSVKDLTFSFSKKPVFSHLNLSLNSGEVLAVVGHNGAGKTTLFHLILGYKFANSGEIKIFNKNVLVAQSREGLGYVPERAYLPLEQSFFSYLKYLAALQNIERDKRDSEAARVASLVGLNEVMHQPMKSYSKGMLQKTMLAQAILGDPQFIILDEPMSGLDPEARQDLRAQIQSWKKQGKTVLFSTHALDDVETLADRVMVLDQGKMMFSGTTNEWVAQTKRGVE
jgi:ABC-2 type transport system ATP-binding protein